MKKRKYSWLWLHSYYYAFFNVFIVGSIDLYVYQAWVASFRTHEICVVPGCNGSTQSGLLWTLHMLCLYMRGPPHINGIVQKLDPNLPEMYSVEVYFIDMQD